MCVIGVNVPRGTLNDLNFQGKLKIGKMGRGSSKRGSTNALGKNL
jgi:hypothetical protein